ncbi:MAG: recombinase family protein [Proteobacteria bacterium]|nr:recombinase family protein [Pseudomonadota bacterium]
MSTKKFALLARVSTKAQEAKGVSLDVQLEQMKAAVRHLNGTVAKIYRGQESAFTPEREILNEVLSDAEDSVFDAIMVADHSRWSRNSEESIKYFRILRNNKKQFYVLTQGYNLYELEDNFLLSLFSIINERQSGVTAFKSLMSKISNANKNRLSACHKCPYGRKFNKNTNQWEIVEEEAIVIRQAADLIINKNYSCFSAAKELNMYVGTLHKRLMSSGKDWTQSFRSERHNINETIKMSLPPVLSNREISLIKSKLKAKRTWDRTPAKNKYLLSRLIKDANSNYSLTGATTPSGKKCYRLQQGPREHRYSIKASEIENVVLNPLFEALGSDHNIQRLIFQERSHSTSYNELKQQLSNIQSEIKNKNILLNRTTDALISTDKNEFNSMYKALTEKMKKLDGELLNLNKKFMKLKDMLDNIPTEKESLTLRETIRKHLIAESKSAYVSSGIAYSDLSFEQKRKLLGLLFSGENPYGITNGIFITCLDKHKHKFKFKARGQFFSISGDNEEGLVYPFYLDTGPQASTIAEIIHQEYPGLVGTLDVTSSPKS